MCGRHTRERCVRSYNALAGVGEVLIINFNLQQFRAGRYAKSRLEEGERNEGTQRHIQRSEIDFEDLGEIGRGGFGSVRKVRHRLENTLYALKVITLKPSEFKDSIEDRLYHVIEEAKTLSSFRHPNILRYHSAWIQFTPYLPEDTPCQPPFIEEEFQMIVNDRDGHDDDGFVFGPPKHQQNVVKKNHFREEKQFHIHQTMFNEELRKNKEIKVFILTEKCEETLRKYIFRRNREAKKKNKARNQSEQSMRNFEIITDVIEGLEYLHSKRIIHRDINYQNIALNNEKKCKIIDFGLAKKVRMVNSACYNSQPFKQLPQSICEGVGTKIFSSPEQSNCEKYDHRTDIYSLAIVIIVLFSTLTTVHEEIQLLHRISQRDLTEINIAPPLKELLLRCLGQEDLRPSLMELKTCIKELGYNQLIKSAKDLTLSLENKRESNENQCFEINTFMIDKKNQLVNAQDEQKKKNHVQIKRGNYEYHMEGNKLIKRTLSDAVTT